MPSPAISALASGSAKGERLPRNSGTTCSPPARCAAADNRRTALPPAGQARRSGRDLPPWPLRMLRPRPDASATRWSIAAPAADWPPSLSHRPGTIAEKYGPQTPGTKAGSLVAGHGAGRGAEDIGHARLQRADVACARRPCRRRRHGHRSGRRRPACPAAGRDRPRRLARQALRRARCRRSTISVPMRAKPSSASAPRPMARK